VDPLVKAELALLERLLMGIKQPQTSGTTLVFVCVLFLLPWD